MPNIRMLADKVRLVSEPAEKFKTSCISVSMALPMDERMAANSLLVYLLKRSCEAYPEMSLLNGRLDELYGATFGTLVRRVGDYQTTGVYCGFMDDRFALEGDQVLSPIIGFLEEILMDSPLENGGFLPSFVESEKKNLIATIESQLNDKRVYASGRLLKIMCENDTFGLPRLGEKEDVAAIQPQELYAHFLRLRRESHIEVFYVGSADAELQCLRRYAGGQQFQSIGGSSHFVLQSLAVALYVHSVGQTTHYQYVRTQISQFFDEYLTHLSSIVGNLACTHHAYDTCLVQVCSTTVVKHHGCIVALLHALGIARIQKTDAVHLHLLCPFQFLLAPCQARVHET